jgi:hypothetical protein
MISETRCRAIVKGRCEDDTGWPRCEAQIPGAHIGGRTEYQHRKAKAHCSREELWAPRNGLRVCGMGNTSGCHGFIHQNPNIAVANGWTVKSGKNDPGLVPVYAWLHSADPVMLDNFGGWREATEDECRRAGLFGPWGYLNSEDMGVA